MPGDIILGDDDGLAVVPRADAAEVLEQVLALEERERRRIAAIKAGELFKAEIDETLRRRGVLE
jgi:regulator of RNase E activity RraA